MKETKRGQLVKRLLSDSAWSIAGLVLMNMTAQFAVYPLWNRELGNDAYGRILYLIAGMNIIAVSMGVACNYARMKARTELLGIATMWRYYADVEYRLKLDYKSFFIYYLVISIGYGIGAGLFLWLKLWPLALLPGEMAGIFLVYRRGTVLRKTERENAGLDQAVTGMVTTLFATEVISNLILNGDRMLLNLLVNATAVTVYYQASLMGKTMALVTMPLNSVLIGYLSRFKGGLTKKIMNRVTLACLAAVPLATLAATVGSHILIRILYPQNYELVSPYFIMANTAQVAFFVSGVAATVLLRFCKTGYQLYINLVYAGLFVALCIPGVLLWQVEGLCIGMMIAGLLKLGYVLLLGYKSIKNS